MKDSRNILPQAITPIALFFLALLPRVIGLRWGLPDTLHWYSYHPDEFQIFSSVANLDFFSGQFNPHFFNYPSLYLYLTYIVHTLLSGFGIFHLDGNNPAIIWQMPQQILLTARWISAVLGAGTAVLVYAIIRLWRPNWHPAYAIFGGVLLAIAPGHVQHSHFATVDIAATFFIALSLFFAVYAAKNPEENRAFFWSCFVAGLAAATKYNAGFIIFAPLVILFLEPQLRERIKVLLPVLFGLGIIGFIVGCPYSILGFKEFWGDGQNTGLAYELFVHPRQGQGDVFANTGNGWIYHLATNLPFTLTWAFLALAISGVIAAIAAGIKKSRDAIGWGIGTFALLYFFSLGMSQVRFMRYVLPLVPVLAICAAFGAAHIKVLLGKQVKVLLCGIILAITGWGSVNVLANFVKEDPRTQAAQFIHSYANSPTVVGIIDVPRFWSPPLVPQDIIFGSNLTLEDIEKTSGIHRFLFQLTGFDAEKLEQEKPQWFVMSEFEWRDEQRLRPQQFQEFMNALEHEYKLQGTYKNQLPLALPGRNFVPHDFLYTNPEIRVYERKNSTRQDHEMHDLMHH